MTDGEKQSNHFDPESYPALMEFLPAYLHEDFGVEYGSAARAFAALVSDANGDQIRNVNDYISAVQIGVTMCSIGIGALGEPALAAIFKSAFGTTISRQGGFLTMSLAWIVHRISGGHRKGTHSFIGVAVFFKLLLI